MNANRENIKKDLGLDKVDIGKIGKEAGRRWGEMTADDKKEWEEKANQARQGALREREGELRREPSQRRPRPGHVSQKSELRRLV
ncbi:hypothetical protein WR25_24699 [Diploscapter pachys]|uniref:HMG box domain-containing protein n=1 Tax=Diploscapter pachys TaxID=2018661 RepID=A0A2A2L5J8_9BILA|nr:hypothetical protein WR25_24699 [Diploscapter pachys]